MKKVLVLVSVLLVASVAWAGYWQSNVVESQHGGYNALVEYVDDDGYVKETRTVGNYESKRKARKAAKNKADELNESEGVKHDPSCDDPLFNC